MKRKLTAILLLAIMVITYTAHAEDVDYYREITDNLNIIQVIDSADLTTEMLENRNGKLIIEKIIGIVTDNNGNGKILNAPEQFNYISYKYVEGAQKGNVILTYCVYNPYTDYYDDILYRFDYILIE